MAWQTPSCVTSCPVRYIRAGESGASFPHHLCLCSPSGASTCPVGQKTLLLLLPTLPQYYVGLDPTNENREERTKDHYMVQSSPTITIPNRDQKAQGNPHHSSRSIRPKDRKVIPNMPHRRCPNKWSSQTYNSFTHSFFPDIHQ